MINNKKLLALIPARGGSKGIPVKNIMEIAGKPLIAYSILQAKASKYINRNYNGRIKYFPILLSQ